MLEDLNKPVILTYAQRSIDRGSSDAALNLTCASYAALSEIAEVTLVGHATLNDDYCFALRGNKVRKMHTSRRDTFRPINELPLAKIYENGDIKIINKNFNKRDEKKKLKLKAFFEERTALIKFYPGAKPDILQFLRQQHYKGIVIEATGFGHVATSESRYSWLGEIRKCINEGIIICFVPQTIYGRLNPYVYSPSRKLLKSGVLFLEDMLAETAYIKLAWLLGHKKLNNKEEKIKASSLLYSLLYR